MPTLLEGKKAPKSGILVGVGGRPGRGTVGITTGSAVSRLEAMKDATGNNKVTFVGVSDQSSKQQDDENG